MWFRLGFGPTSPSSTGSSITISQELAKTSFVGLSLLLLVGIGTARGARAWPRQSATRDLAQSLIASLVRCLSHSLPMTYSFPMTSTFLFVILILDCAGRCGGSASRSNSARWSLSEGPAAERDGAIDLDHGSQPRLARARGRGETHGRCRHGYHVFDVVVFVPLQVSSSSTRR